MAVMRIHKTANYTIMSNHHFKEREMSLKAKGLLSLMLSLPDDWDYSIAGLATLSRDGKDSVMSALKELETFGYLTRTRLVDERGRFAGYDYDIFEEPRRAPYSENPQTETPQAENPRQSNTYQQKTEKENDIRDKKDKRLSSGESFSENLSILESEEPNIFTKELVKIDYIEPDSLYIEDYNDFFNEMAATYGFEVLRSCLWYFVNRIKSNGAVDEHGRPIIARLSYCRIAIEQGAKRLTADPSENPLMQAWGL